MRLGTATAIDDVHAMHWREFEQLVADLLVRAGYEAARIGGRRDHGADVIATKNAEKLAIQVKHRSDGRWVGERAVQAVVAAAVYHDCTRGIVVTNSSFAPDVASVARKLRVTLRDREWLRRELLSYCALCERRVSARVRTWCLDRPAEFHGDVFCFDHQRRFEDILRTA